jgi:hypothetical protein
LVAIHLCETSNRPSLYVSFVYHSRARRGPEVSSLRAKGSRLNGIGLRLFQTPINQLFFTMTAMVHRQPLAVRSCISYTELHHNRALHSSLLLQGAGFRVGSL